MSQTKLVSEAELASLAKRYRMEARKTRAQAARDMKVAQTSIFQAEEIPGQALIKLRMRMIEAYSKYVVAGPFYSLKSK